MRDCFKNFILENKIINLKQFKQSEQPGFVTTPQQVIVINELERGGRVWKHDLCSCCESCGDCCFATWLPWYDMNYNLFFSLYFK